MLEVGGTHCDWCDADSGEHLLDQSVAIVERLHHQSLLSGHLRKNELFREVTNVYFN